MPATRQRDVLKEIPSKIGIDIKQTAAGFSVLQVRRQSERYSPSGPSDLKQFKTEWQRRIA